LVDMRLWTRPFAQFVKEQSLHAKQGVTSQRRSMLFSSHT
jgi:hypothetical protein